MEKTAKAVGTVTTIELFSLLSRYRQQVPVPDCDKAEIGHSCLGRRQ
jgi:hypothetical protein